MLLKMPKIWKQQQLLYADRLLTNSLMFKLNSLYELQFHFSCVSVTNVRNGDDEASRFVYHCKLYHLSQNYPVCFSITVT